ncbi:hypothetical protein [Bordetella sp. LUAb4]|uniref:hypothetical protein n=1 Tax=Bordetella sp. LUAb4 TaxID=2843195 RepID=UPI001E649D89|nr:hypothetical protein [Bordetella sp. LUAb4]
MSIVSTSNGPMQSQNHLAGNQVPECDDRLLIGLQESSENADDMTAAKLTPCRLTTAQQEALQKVLEEQTQHVDATHDVQRTNSARATKA